MIITVPCVFSVIVLHLHFCPFFCSFVYLQANQALNACSYMILCYINCTFIFNNQKLSCVYHKPLLWCCMAGRGMNAAFAIGRLCDMDVGRQQLLTLPESEKMVSEGCIFCMWKNRTLPVDFLYFSSFLRCMHLKIVSRHIFFFWSVLML